MTGVLLVSVLIAYVAQQVLTPVLAPLSREVGLGEVQLGLVITVAAAVFSLGSLAWGRVADRWGHRRVLLTGMLLATAGLVLFALVCQWAMGGERPVGRLLTGMILTRSLLFGIGIAAVPVAALAHISSITSGEKERTRAVSLVGAAQAVALAVGPGLGGLLAIVQLLAPVWVAPVLLAAAVVAVVALLPAAGGATPAADTPRTRMLSPFDPRVRPFLAVGFLLFVSLGVLQVVLGFLVQDRLGLDARQTAGRVGILFLGVGIALIAVQAVLVPRLGWGPARLLRTGSPIAVVGFVALAVAPGFALMAVAMVVIAVGIGLGMPGFTAGPGLRVGPGEQGGVAGLVSATTGATFVVGPLAGTALYELDPAVPLWVGAGSCLLAAVVALVSRSIATPRPSGEAYVPGAPR